MAQTNAREGVMIVFNCLEMAFSFEANSHNWDIVYLMEYHTLSFLQLRYVFFSMFIACGMEFVYLGQVQSRIGRQSESILGQREKIVQYLFVYFLDLITMAFLSICMGFFFSIKLGV